MIPSATGTEQNKMSNYQPAITKNNDGSFFALVIRIDADGEENVIHGYKGRHFKTEKAALKSTNTHIAKYC
jgi:demethoxyubiquinone hydroxylase (CLK1/Coq7/Cat5 family)